MSTLGRILREKLGQIESAAGSAAAWFDQVETLRWWRVSEQLPPIDVDVLGSWGDGRGTYQVAWLGDGRGWCGGDAMPLESAPIYWCAFPVGPVDPNGKP